MEPESVVKNKREVDKGFLLKSILNYAFTQGDSVALWRLPNETQQQLIVSKSVQKIQPSQPLEDLTEGFMIAPFLESNRTFLSADYYFRFVADSLVGASSPNETDSHAWLQQQKFNPVDKLNFYTRQPGKQTKAESDTFIELVKKSIVLIEQGVVEKIVPSRSKTIVGDLDLLEAFDKLCKRHPSAMVSLISTPEHGTWLGATPEVLVTIEGNTIFKTVALAGTKVWQEGTDCKNVAWTQKEIEEQALVERYIISCFKKIRLREYDEHGPKTIVAGNLMHLKSDFTVDMKVTNFPQLGSVMLNLLHPTSAVCGMPKEESLSFLLNNEEYNRELYSGYIGPVNIQNNTHLFVNLRCLQWHNTTATLYAGAGVTIDSDPQKEWEETEMKMRTLLDTIY